MHVCHLYLGHYSFICHLVFKQFSRHLYNIPFSFLIASNVGVAVEAVAIFLSKPFHYTATAEAKAIDLALDFINDCNSYNKFVIFSDSLSVLQALNYTMSKNQQIQNILGPYRTRIRIGRSLPHAEP